MRKVYTVHPEEIKIPNDPASLERGRHLALAVAGCMGCHGRDMAGKVLVDNPMVARFVPTNLTRGKGGIGGKFSDQDWIQAMRHGVRPDGKSLILMPSANLACLSNEDFADIIAYAKSVPPVDKVLPPTKVGPIIRIAILSGKSDMLSAEASLRTENHPVVPKQGLTAEYGHYLAIVAECVHCHGPGLSGGRVPGAPPDVPPAANLTPVGIGGWKETDFLRSLRQGKRPDGSVINEFMPSEYYQYMTDDEIKALWLYLKTVPPRETGNR